MHILENQSVTISCHKHDMGMNVAYLTYCEDEDIRD